MFSTGYRTLVNALHETMVSVADGKLRIGDEAPLDADIRLFVSELNRLASSDLDARTERTEQTKSSDVEPAAPPVLTHEQLFREVEVLLDTSWIVVADTFLGIHAASDLK